MATNSAGVNFGTPNEEFIIESDGSGALTSARNVVTDTEYVGGGGGFEPFSGTIALKNGISSTSYLAFPCTNGGKEIIRNASINSNASISITTALLINGLFYVGAARSNSGVYFSATGAEFVDQVGTSAYTCGIFRPTAETVEITLNTI